MRMADVLVHYSGLRRQLIATALQRIMLEHANAIAKGVAKESRTTLL